MKWSKEKEHMFRIYSSKPLSKMTKKERKSYDILKHQKDFADGYVEVMDNSDNGRSRKKLGRMVSGFREMVRRIQSVEDEK